MHSFIVRSRALVAPLALALVAAPLAAQTTTVTATNAPTSSQKPTVFDVTPYAGYMHFGNIIDGPLGTSLKSANAPVIGAQLALALGPNLGVVGNIAYGSADLQVGVPILGGLDVGTSRHVVYDADVEYRVPMQSSGAQSITPFVQAGAGAISTKLSNSLLSTSATNFAFNGGAGVDVTVARGFGIRAMVKDYIGRFDISGSTGLPVHGDVTHNVAGSVGVRVSF